MSLLYAAFLGGIASGAVQINATTVYENEANPADASASITFSSAGQATESTGASYNWLLGGNAADFDIKATITSGSFSTGTSGSWLNLASTRSWSVIRTAIGSKMCTATFEISRTGQATAIATASITLTAEVTA